MHRYICVYIYIYILYIHAYTCLTISLSHMHSYRENAELGMTCQILMLTSPIRACGTIHSYVSRLVGLMNADLHYRVYGLGSRV